MKTKKRKQKATVFNRKKSAIALLSIQYVNYLKACFDCGITDASDWITFEQYKDNKKKADRGMMMTKEMVS